MISWPAIISYKGVDELIFILDESEWTLEPDLCSHPYSDEDELIDNKGSIYTLLYDKKSNIVTLKDTGNSITIIEFEKKIKQHMAYLNQCCISKLKIYAINDGMLLVKNT